MTATRTMHVDPTNTDQHRAWDGEEGAYWAAHADRFDRSLAAYRQAFAAAGAIEGADRVLDIGCGAGETTIDAARRAGAGFAVGVDLSGPMLDVARRRAAAAGVGNVAFVHGDAQVHPFEPGSFDVAISRTGAMFFGDPVAAFTNVASALRPGGRLVLLTWGPLAANEWLPAIAGALAAGRGPEAAVPAGDGPAPFSLSAPHRVRHVLDTAGFADVGMAPASGGLWFGADADEAQEFVLGLLGWMLDGLDDAARAVSVAALHEMLDAHQTDDGVLLGSSAWLITATKPG